MQSAVLGTRPDISDIPKVDWRAVSKEAEQQAVTAMALDASAEIKEHIPKEVYDEWCDKALLHLVNNAKVTKSQTALVKLLEENSFPYVVMKGEAIASYYPRPELRLLGDVDFLIDPADKEAVSDLLRKNGYKSDKEDHGCHTVFKKPSAHLEMHFKLQGLPEGEIGARVDIFMKNALTAPKRQKGDGGEFNTLNPWECGLVVLLHIQHHMVAEGVGLRHLCDWGCFINATANHPFWQEKLVGLFRETGLLTYASAITRLCQKAFSTPCPDWVEAIDDAVCDALLEDVFSGGNFGRKDKDRARTGSLITDKNRKGFEKSKWRRMLEVLRENIRTKHPSVNKYPILYPFFFVYRVVKYFAMTLVGKRPPITKVARNIDKRKNIYKKLRIFEV